MKRIFVRCVGPSIILLMLVACQRSATPTSPLFTDAQLTSIASTAQASQLQTQQAYTPTPIPATSTPVVSTISGTSLVMRDDQTAQFIDHKAGIQLIIPSGWLPVRMNEDEYYKAFALDVVAASKPLTDRLTQIQSYNIDIFRLDAIDIRPDHVVDDIISDISMVFEKDDHTFAELQQAERGRKTPLKHFKILSSQYDKTADGTQVLIVEESWDGTPTATAYLRRVFFRVPAGTVILDLQSNLEFKDTVLPDFALVLNSLTVLNPK